MEWCRIKIWQMSSTYNNLFFFFSGSEFLCNTHIIPVKNEEGVVMMFILNFDYVQEEERSESPEKLSLTPSAKTEDSKFTSWNS